MKLSQRSVRFLVLVTVVTLMLAVFAVPALAQGETPPATPPDLSAAWGAFLALVGWPAFLVAAINLLKFAHILPDGWAGKVTYWVNVAAFVGVAYLVFSGQTNMLTSIDSALSTFAKVLVDILILLGGGVASLAMNKFYYGQVRGYPLIGFTHPKK